jgi:magnesium and cobalt transporter
VFAAKVMTKKENIIWVGADATIQNAIKVFQASGFSRLPVYDLNLKEPIGVIRLKDFLPFVIKPETHQESIEKFVQKPLFVSSRFTLNRVLLFFREKRNHMAFILSMKGEYLGLITLDDILKNIQSGNSTDSKSEKSKSSKENK